MLHQMQAVEICEPSLSGIINVTAETLLGALYPNQVKPLPKRTSPLSNKKAGLIRSFMFMEKTISSTVELILTL
jgi:hypothetical protein